MNPILLAQLISSLGTVGLPLVAKIIGDIQAGRTETTVTPQDISEVDRLAKQTSADIWARLGIALPPSPKPAGVGAVGDDPPLNPN